MFGAFTNNTPSKENLTPLSPATATQYVPVCAKVTQCVKPIHSLTGLGAAPVHTPTVFNLDVSKPGPQTPVVLVVNGRGTEPASKKFVPLCVNGPGNADIFA